MRARHIRLFLAIVLVAGAIQLSSAAGNKVVRIAIGDTPGVDSVLIEIAAARTRNRGVPVEIQYLQSEEYAFQAVLNHLADIGVGTPYGQIQKNNAPVRIIYQLNSLRFFPVVSSEHYQNWKDLDGAEIYVHGPGSGTEAIMKMMAIKHRITYAKIHYLPGSGVRSRGLLQGRIRASIVDTTRRNQLARDGNGRFSMLPVPQVHATDEALYAHREFLEKNRSTVGQLLEELLAVWRETINDPSYATDARRKYRVLPNLRADDVNRINEYYADMVSVNALSKNGGVECATLVDFEFYRLAGTLRGDSKTVKVNDFWKLGPLERALANVGKVPEECPALDYE